MRSKPAWHRSILVVGTMVLLVSCGGGGGQPYDCTVVSNSIGLVRTAVEGRGDAGLAAAEAGSCKCFGRLARQTGTKDLSPAGPSDSFSARGINYAHFERVFYNGVEHILAVQTGGLTLDLYGNMGRLVEQFDIPRYGLEIHAIVWSIADQQVLVILVDQQATSHTSTLLVLDSSYQVRYQEHLSGAYWLCRMPDGFIVATEPWCYVKKKRESTGGIWRYGLSEAAGGSGVTRPAAQ